MPPPVGRMTIAWGTTTSKDYNNIQHSKLIQS